jgi:hypothetical protein
VYTFRWHPQDTQTGNRWTGAAVSSAACGGVEATVNDGSNQTVSSFATVEVYNALERIALDTGGYLHKPNEAFTLKVQVTDIDARAGRQPRV